MTCKIKKVQEFWDVRKVREVQKVSDVREVVEGPGGSEGPQCLQQKGLRILGDPEGQGCLKDPDVTGDSQAWKVQEVHD